MAAKDKFANILNFSVTLSAANTLTFEEINIGLNLFDKVGLLVHRVKFGISSIEDQLNEDNDAWQAGLTTSDQLSGLGLDQQAVIDMFSQTCHEYGTAGNMLVLDQTYQVDYSGFPGGGLLIAPKPLYLGLTTVGYSSAATMNGRLFFTVMKMSPSDYFELLESRQFFG